MYTYLHINMCFKARNGKCRERDTGCWKQNFKLLNFCKIQKKIELILLSATIFTLADFQNYYTVHYYFISPETYLSFFFLLTILASNRKTFFPIRIYVHYPSAFIIRFSKINIWANEIFIIDKKTKKTWKNRIKL